MRNTVRRYHDGTVAATVTGTGAWVDLDCRGLVVPPAELLAVIADVRPADDYQPLPSPRSPAVGNGRRDRASRFAATGTAS